MTNHTLKIQKGQLIRNEKNTLKRHLKRNGGSISFLFLVNIDYKDMKLIFIFIFRKYEINFIFNVNNKRRDFTQILNKIDYTFEIDSNLELRIM